MFKVDTKSTRKKMGNMFKVNNNVFIVDFQQVNVSQQPLYKRNDFRDLRARTSQIRTVKSVQIGSVSWPLFVGNEEKGRISKWMLQENKARQISQKTNIFCHWVIWCALNAGNTGFEIHSFALLPTYIVPYMDCEDLYREKFGPRKKNSHWYTFHTFTY